MNYTWGQAWGVAGKGFGIVFIVLIILAVAVFVSGLVIKKIESKTSTDDKKS